MATEIISIGFAPGPLTKRDLERVSMAQPVQLKINAELIIFVLAVAIALLAATLFVRVLRELPIE